MSRVYRSRRDRWFTGLCGGLAESFGISAGILRLLVVIAIPFTSGAIILLYLIASLVVSKEPFQPQDPYYGGGWNPGYGPGPGPGPYRFGPKDDPRFSQRPPFPPPYRDDAPPRYNDSRRGSDGFGRAGESNLDYMMGDIEKKAMQKELEELRKKLAKYENGKNEKGEV
ncbi:PspC domain-containing protein [Paenibacillus caui]|uniref:PspC domain-containing protein n=1 Tax=Paenibacillus caui TaxID=2873927 RepID=UPI001CA8680E